MTEGFTVAALLIYWATLKSPHLTAPPPMRTMHVRVARLTALGLMLSVFACRDSVAPGRQAASASGSSELVESAHVVRVSPDSSRGWMFFDDQHGAACLEADNCHIARDTSAAHFAETSIELATPTAADGDVLMLPAFRGVRLDRITELRYSTYRESPDSGDRLAVMLQLNVDYDLGDAYTAYEGRIVFEPAQGQRGAVPMGQWQRWDARAGRWWGTKTVVRLGGVETLGVCTKASPCSWSQLLAAYPNIGIHAANGAIVLQAGANWAAFRGNTDSLTVGVNGVATTYDFGRVFPVTEPPHLYARIGDGIVGARLAADTIYAPGARVSYSFAATPGREGPWVVLDDTLAAASGTIVMDGTHYIEVVTDTIYTLDGLSADGKQLSRLFKALVASADKVGAYREIMDFYIQRMNEGADQDALTRESRVAWRLTVDPVRDATALAAVNSALDGMVFSMAYDTPGVTDVYPVESEVPPLWRGSRAMEPADLRAAVPLPPGFDPSSGAARVPISQDQIDSPREPTVILYVNGVFTEEYQAALTTTRLRSLVLSHARFANGATRVDHVYNSSGSVQMKAWDKAHPCVKNAIDDAQSGSLPVVVTIKFAVCAERHDLQSFVSFDLVASVTQRIELLRGVEPSSPDPKPVAEYITKHRTTAAYPEHVIIVAHSDGTIVVPAALKLLPAMEGHPIQDARACLATLSLAGAERRSMYDLEEPYKSGFIIERDVIHVVPLVDGWDELHTAASDVAGAAIAASVWPGLSEGNKLLTALLIGVQIHSIDGTYLSDPGSREQIFGRLSMLHKECLQGDLTVSPDRITAEAGTQFTMVPKLLNQHGRELHGRLIFNTASPDGTIAEGTSPYQFLARTPREFEQHFAYFTPYVYGRAGVTIPIAKIAGTAISEVHASWWEIYAESNGGALCPCGIEDLVPTIEWDGGEDSCTQYVTYYGISGWAGPSYRTWVRRCNRGYLVTPGAVTEPVVASQVLAFRWRWTFTNGGVTYEQYEPDVWCWDASRCLASVTVWGYDRNNVNIATSGPVAAATGGSGVSPFLTAGQLPTAGALSKSTAARDAARAKAVRAAQARLRRTS